MTAVHAKFSASISELKKSPTALLKEAGNEPIAILNHNRPSAYLIPAELYEQMLDALDEKYLSDLVSRRRQEHEQIVEVSLDEL